MDCGPEDYASSVLERYGYYRLSGYWYPYREWPRTCARPSLHASKRTRSR